MERFHGIDLLHYCGGGAYGDVYFGKDVSGRTLAVKIISKTKLGAHWERELKGVIHYRKLTEDAPELLQIHHVEEDETTFFYTMEAADSTAQTPGTYLPDTLAERLKQGPLAQTAIFPVLAAIFQAIRTIHNAGFVHRDIKPDNILFVRGVPKLGDIGLLSSLESTSTQIAGTLDFLPPELRCISGPDASDRLSRQRNDLYAFGKVIYCTVTGQEPNLFPAVPKLLALSNPCKFFLRLAFQLCDRDPARRMNSMTELEMEFAAIERKLLYGETLRDKLVYRTRQIGIGCRSFLIHAAEFFRKNWIAVGIALLLIAGGVWYFKPAPAFDMALEKTQTYYNKDCKFSMTLPKQWEILDNDTVQKKIAEKEANGELPFGPDEQKKNEFLLSLLKMGVDFIYCDFDEEKPDNICVQSLPIPGQLLQELSDTELRVNIRQLHQGELGLSTEIYDMKRMEIQGIPCVFIDLSQDPGKTRINNYLFAFPDRCCTVALTARLDTFEQRQKEFQQVIESIRFEKN